MAGVALAVRGSLRRRARPLLGLVVLGGLGAGLALACLAGTRRTESAYDRFLENSRPGDLEVGFDEDVPLDEKFALIDQVRSLPQVESSAGASWLFHTVPGQPVDALITIAAIDDRFGHTMQIPQIVDGRLPDPTRVDELALDEIAAEDLDLGVGDTIELETVPADQVEAFFTNQPVEGERNTLTVTGVVRYPGDLESFDSSGDAFLTPAYWDAHAPDGAFFGPAVYVDLAPGQRDEFESAVGELLEPSAVNEVEEASGVSVEDATHVQGLSLLLFAAIVAGATLIFLTLGYSRQALSGEDDVLTLAALGMRRFDRWLTVVAPALLAAVATAVLAALVAILLSPLFPFGIAGRAEPDPGFDLDLAVVLGGTALVAAGLAAVASLVAVVGLRRVQRRDDRREQALPLPLVPALGIGMALRPGRGRRAVPTRSALITATVGIALFVATVSFGRSLDQLVDDPVRYGWDADLVTGTSDDPDTFDDVAPIIEADERIGDWSVASVVELAAGDQRFWTMGLDAVEGDIGPVIIDGRAPTAPDEVALGRETLEDLDADVGDEIEVTSADGGPATTLDVVGTAVLPGGDHDFPSSLGEGGVMTLDGLGQVTEAPRHVYFARAAPGVDPAQLVADYQAERPGIYGPNAGPEIANLDEASAVIPALVLSIGVLGVIAMAHALVVTVRRRRHELALLGSLGLRPRELTGIVLIQATVIAVLALVIGIPVGIVVAKPAWGAAARNVGVGDDLAAYRPLDLALLVGTVLLVSLVLAAVPARLAARLRPAVVLRTE